MRGPLLAPLLLAGLSGCAREEPRGAAPVDPIASSAVITASPASTSSPAILTSAPMPAPHRGRLASAVALNARCVSCHDEEARQWRGSQHQRAFVDAPFRRAFDVERTSFCRGCHAPEADPSRDPPAAVAELGVACVTCHVTEEGVVLAGLRDHEGPESAPHPLRRSREFGVTGCAACHEFRFPALEGDDDASHMQTTAREHRRSPAAEEACVSCHMPLREGRRAHGFAEARDPGWLRRMIEVRAERAGEDRVRLTLSQTTPGHAFPTGDLFRRLEVGCAVTAPSGEPLSREVRHLARHFALVPGASGRRLVRDDRVFDDPRVIEIDLPSTPRGAKVTWWVSYQRAATIGAGLDPRDVDVESEVLLHNGALPWDHVDP